MKHIFSLFLICLLLLSCGGNTDGDKASESAYLDKIDTASIIEIAQIMKRDISERLKKNDIQAVGALCQEGLDNIDYFQSIGEPAIAGLYTRELRSFPPSEKEELGDMAKHNYIIKQFVITVRGTDTSNTPRNQPQQQANQKTQETAGKNITVKQKQ